MHFGDVSDSKQVFVNLVFQIYFNHQNLCIATGIMTTIKHDGHMPGEVQMTGNSLEIRPEAESL